MSNPYYTATGWPATSADGDPQDARDELALIEDGFDLLPELSGNGDNAVFVNTAGTALESVTASAARTLLSLAIGTDVLEWDNSTLDLIVSSADPDMTSKLTAFTSGGASAITPVVFQDVDTPINAANYIMSQQGIKAYIENTIVSMNAYMAAPDTTYMKFFQVSAPTGWNIIPSYDNRVPITHSTSTGNTSGTKEYNTSITSGNNDVNHTHDYTLTGTTGADTSQVTVTNTGSSDDISDYQHDHGITVTGTTGNQSPTNHTHSLGTPNGIYVALCRRNDP